MNPYEYVSHGGTLRMLERAGLILEPDVMFRPTGATWGKRKDGTGYRYVKDCPGGLTTSSWTLFRGREYRLEYQDGCFFPFVKVRSPERKIP